MRQDCDLLRAIWRSRNSEDTKGRILFEIIYRAKVSVRWCVVRFVNYQAGEFLRVELVHPKETITASVQRLDG